MTVDIANTSWVFTDVGGSGDYESANPNGGVSGPPVISNISGTFAQDNVLTITGSNISSNRSGQLIYENFDAGTEGNPITDIPSFTHTAGNTAAHAYEYDNAQSFSGSQSAYLPFVVGDASGFRPQFDSGVELNSIYVHMKQRLSRITEVGPATQIKLARAISVSDDHTSQPSIGVTYIPSNTLVENTTEGIAGQSFYGPDPSEDTWQTYSYYLELGTLNTQDGARWLKAIGGDDWTYSGFTGENFSSVSNDGTGGNQNPPEAWEPSYNIETLGSGTNETFLRYLLLPFFKRTDDVYDLWIDQLSINDSLEAVFISPESTWTLARSNYDSMVIQPMTSRASGEVVVECETGDLGATRYLYVVNSDGEANETGESI